MFSTEGSILMPIILTIIIVFLIMFVYSFEEIMYQSTMDNYLLSLTVDQLKISEKDATMPGPVLIVDKNFYYQINDNKFTGKMELESSYSKLDIEYSSLLYRTKYLYINFIRNKAKEISGEGDE